MNSLLVLVASALAITGLEVGLRWVAWYRGSEDPTATGDQYAFYRYDSTLGWRNVPNARGTFRRSEFAFPLRINALGLRGADTPRAKPSGVRRVAFLGDSFTWGIGAADSELASSLIARRIPGVEVLNFGVSGYGPIQYLLQTDEVLAFQPDLIVIVFCLGNDFIDNVLWQRYGYYKPFARLDTAGALVIDGTPPPNIRDLVETTPAWLTVARRSEMARVTRRAIERVRGPAPPPTAAYGQRGLVQLADDGSDLYRTPHDSVVELAIRINTRLFERIAARYQAAGIPLVVVASPTKCEFGDCFADLPAPSDAARRALARSLEGLPLTLIDPTPAFLLSDFWVRDRHWRPSGHQKLADALLVPIADILASPTRAPRATTP